MHHDFTDAELTRAENRFYDEQEEELPEPDWDQILQDKKNKTGWFAFDRKTGRAIYQNGRAGIRDQKEEREERRLANQ